MAATAAPADPAALPPCCFPSIPCCPADPAALLLSLHPCRAACICYLRALGTPIYNFQLRQLPALQAAGQQAQQGSWQLAYCCPDPLLEAGGLEAVSEGGRLAAGGGEDAVASDGAASEDGSEAGEEEWADSDDDEEDLGRWVQA